MKSLDAATMILQFTWSLPGKSSHDQKEVCMYPLSEPRPNSSWRHLGFQAFVSGCSMLGLGKPSLLLRGPHKPSNTWQGFSLYYPIFKKGWALGCVLAGQTGRATASGPGPLFHLPAPLLSVAHLSKLHEAAPAILPVHAAAALGRPDDRLERRDRTRTIDSFLQRQRKQSPD